MAHQARASSRNRDPIQRTWSAPLEPDHALSSNSGDHDRSATDASGLGEPVLASSSWQQQYAQYAQYGEYGAARAGRAQAMSEGARPESSLTEAGEPFRRRRPSPLGAQSAWTPRAALSSYQGPAPGDLNRDRDSLAEGSRESTDSELLIRVRDGGFSALGIFSTYAVSGLALSLVLALLVLPAVLPPLPSPPVELLAIPLVIFGLIILVARVPGPGFRQDMSEADRMRASYGS